MKEFLQKLDVKKIGYIVAAAAVLSVLIAGVRGIITVQNIGVLTYNVQEQHVGPVEATGVFSHEFLCVGEDTIALHIDGVIEDTTVGNLVYEIIDSEGNIALSGEENIQNVRHDVYGGVWLEVQGKGLVQGVRYILTLDFSDVENMQVYVGQNHMCIRQFYNFTHKTLYTCIIIAIIAMAIVWLVMVYKKGYGPVMYLVTTLVVGIFVIFAMPAVSRDDEYRHFLRGYMDVAKIQPVFEKVTGGESGLIGTQPNGENMVDVPYEINEIRLLGYEDNFNGYGYVQEQNQFFNIDKLIAELKAEPLDTTHRVAATGVALKGNGSYLPQIIAMKVASALGVRAILFHHVARFGQLLVCILMELLAMKLAPKMKEMIWLLAFIPNAFLLKASCNPDGFMISIMILLASIFVWMKDNKVDVISLKAIPAWMLYLVLIYFVFIMKVPYMIIAVGMFLYLGKDNVAKAWNWIKNHKKATVGIGVGIVAAGLAVVTALKDTLLLVLYFFLPINYMEYIAGHPLEIAKLFVGKWIEMFINLYSGMKGENLLPYPILVVAILLMLKKQQPIIKRVWFAFLFGLMVMVIVLVGYTLTPPDYGQIWGIGYRYLLPFMVVGTLCLPAGNEKTEKIAVQIMPLAIFVTMTVTLITWFVRWSV